MSGFALHPEAFIDLDGIREHIAEDNPDAAGRVITEIFDRIRVLVTRSLSCDWRTMKEGV